MAPHLSRVFSILCLAALFTAHSASADPTRGWRAGSGAANSNSLTAHYVSPGLQDGDSAIVKFFNPGDVPTRLFWSADPQELAYDMFTYIWSRENYLAKVGYECGTVNSTMYEDPNVMECVARVLWRGATLDFQFLANMSDYISGWEGNPVVAFAGFGFYNVPTNRYMFVSRAPTSGFCTGDEEQSVCAACFSDFQALTAGAEPEPCLPTASDPATYVVNIRIGYADLMEASAKSAAEFSGETRIALLFTRQSGGIFGVRYTDDDLLAALLADR